MATFGIRQRMLLVEPAQQCPGRVIGFAFVEIPAQADVAVGEREQRLHLTHALQVELRLADAPRLHRERPAFAHRIGRPPVTATRAPET
jgi:hypothetical protein